MKLPQRRWLRISLWQPTNPAWWFVVLAIVGGLVGLTWLLMDSVVSMPVVGITAFILLAPVTAFWWWFMTRPQLYGRMHVTGAITAFLWGAFVSTALYALIANEAIIILMGQYLSIDIASAFGAAVAAPFTEEIGKGLGIIMVMVVARRWARTPMEGAFIGGFVGLGFEVFEHWLYAYNLATLNFGEEPAIIATLAVVLRAGIFGLFSHMLMSALVGAGIAYLISRRSIGQVAWGLLSMFLGWLFHTMWNSPWPSIIFNVIMLLVLPAIFYVMVKLWRRHEQQWFREVMAGEVARGTLDQRYVDGMQRSLWARRRYRRKVQSAWGPQAYQMQMYIEGLMIDLADAVSTADEVAANAYRAAIQRVLGTPEPAAAPEATTAP